MTRKVFFSLHYKPDCWRASQVRNMGTLEGNEPVSDNDWEEVTASGDAAIEAWIKTQMSNRSCAVVLIGNKTSERKWVKYEIATAWNANKGVVGIYVHNLKDDAKVQAAKGANPLDRISVEGVKLSTIAKAYDPPFTTSTNVYNHIKENIEEWVEEAITIRNDN
jgi:hypothetical protein